MNIAIAPVIRQAKSHLLLGYRSISFLALSGIFFGILWYIISFVLMSTDLARWSVPMVLSPTQTMVLQFQPQLATLQTTLDTQRISLATNQQTVEAIKADLSNVNDNLHKVRVAMSTEAHNSITVSRALKTLTVDKNSNIKSTDALNQDIKYLAQQIENELAANLITKDTAAQRRIFLQSSVNSGTDAKFQSTLLAAQAYQLQRDAATYQGGAASVGAMSAIKTKADLEAMKLQLEIQLATATASVTALERQVAESERVLDVAKQSPYFRALREEVTTALVTYPNLSGLRVGDPVYDCALMILICHKAGTIKGFYNAEILSTNPIFKTNIKGRLVQVEFTDRDAAQSQIVFMKHKPLGI